MLSAFASAKFSRFTAFRRSWMQVPNYSWVAADYPVHRSWCFMDTHARSFAKYFEAVMALYVTRQEIHALQGSDPCLFAHSLARFWTSLRNPDCERGQATKNQGPICCAMVRATKNIFHIDLRRSGAAWTLLGNSLGLNGLVR
jgi:hypothetical protein